MPKNPFLLYFLSTEEQVLTLHTDSRSGQPPDLKASCMSEFPNLEPMCTAGKGWRAPWTSSSQPDAPHPIKNTSHTIKISKNILPSLLNTLPPRGGMPFHPWLRRICRHRTRSPGRHLIVYYKVVFFSFSNGRLHHAGEITGPHSEFTNRACTVGSILPGSPGQGHLSRTAQRTDAAHGLQLSLFASRPLPWRCQPSTGSSTEPPAPT